MRHDFPHRLTDIHPFPNGNGRYAEGLQERAIFDTLGRMIERQKKRQGAVLPVMERDGKKKGGRPETRRLTSSLQGMLADAEELALKEIIADQIKEAMKVGGITKTAMAARMRTDRRQLDRLLDPKNPSVTLSTLRRAASAVGRSLRVELV